MSKSVEKRMAAQGHPATATTPTNSLQRFTGTVKWRAALGFESDCGLDTLSGNWHTLSEAEAEMTAFLLELSAASGMRFDLKVRPAP